MFLKVPGAWQKGERSRQERSNGSGWLKPVCSPPLGLSRPSEWLLTVKEHGNGPGHGQGRERSSSLTKARGIAEITKFTNLIYELSDKAWNCLSKNLIKH